MLIFIIMKLVDQTATSRYKNK